MKSDKKGLSIIIPTYQRVTSLLNCIESIHQNTRKKNYEIIIIDDNGDQALSDKIRRRLPKYAAIRYFRNRQRRGPAYSRNKGIKQASYQYISFLDDDCLVPDTWIDDVLRFFREQKKKNVAAVRGKTISISDSRLTKAHVLYETFWLHILHADPNGNKNIIHKTIASLQKKTFSQCIVDFAPSNNLTIDRTELDLSFNTTYKSAAGEDVDLCNKIQDAKKYIAYTQTITVIHNHFFPTKKEFKEKFEMYGRNLGLHSGIYKRLANMILNPFLLSLYYRTLNYYGLFYRIERSINFPRTD